MKCLVVVAHPDDEMIWMGGLILRHPRWKWQVISLCRADDPDRVPRFNLAAKQTGVSAYISDLDDSPMLAPLSPDLREIKQRVSALAEPQYDLIFTHGQNGEYARHERHSQVHQAMRDIVDAGDIQGDLLCFAYDDDECSPRPAADADILFELLEEEYARKRGIVREIYGFGPGSFEYESCGSVEAFRIYQKTKTVGYLRSMLESPAR